MWRLSISTKQIHICEKFPLISALTTVNTTCFLLRRVEMLSFSASALQWPSPIRNCYWNPCIAPPHFSKCSSTTAGFPRLGCMEVEVLTVEGYQASMVETRAANKAQRSRSCSPLELSRLVWSMMLSWSNNCVTEADSLPLLFLVAIVL